MYVCGCGNWLRTWWTIRWAAANEMVEVTYCWACLTNIDEGIKYFRRLVVSQKRSANSVGGIAIVIEPHPPEWISRRRYFPLRMTR